MINHNAKNFYFCVEQSPKQSFTSIYTSSTWKLELSFKRVGNDLNLALHSVCTYLVINFFPLKYLNIGYLFWLKVLRSLQSYTTLKFHITWKLKWCFKRWSIFNEITSFYAIDRHEQTFKWLGSNMTWNTHWLSYSIFDTSCCLE